MPRAALLEASTRALLDEGLPGLQGGPALFENYETAERAMQETGLASRLEEHDRGPRHEQPGWPGAAKSYTQRHRASRGHGGASDTSMTSPYGDRSGCRKLRLKMFPGASPMDSWMAKVPRIPTTW